MTAQFLAERRSQSTTVPAAVSAAGLGKRFGRHWALAHVDLEVPAGGSLLVAGANGSGKTTFLRLVAGLHRPTVGTLSVFGHDTREERLACRRRLTLVSHAGCLYDGLTPRETLRTWARLGGRPIGEPEIEALLAEAELAARGDALIGGFSAGMRKRLTLLRTRIERPQLLMLDEPFSALDVEGRGLVSGWIREFTAAGGALLIASHDLERTAPLCDRAIILERGQQVWSGPASEAVRRRGDRA